MSESAASEGSGSSVGRRVAYWRVRRGMTQQMLGDRVGRSKSWVEKVERGVRRLDRVSVLHEIARVLEIPVEQLLAPAAPEQAADQGEVEDIRAALARYTWSEDPDDADAVPADLGELRGAVDHAWLSFQHGGYDTLTRSLPQLLRRAQHADTHHRHDDDHAARAAHLLAQSYQIASSTLRKTGQPELAWFAADRARAVAVRAGDPLLAGTADSRAGNALLTLGRPRPALETQLVAVNRLAPGDARTATGQQLSVYGSLLLQAAMAAAHLADDAGVRDLIGEAARVVRDLHPAANHYWTSFNATNLSLHRIAADVELGEHRRAADAHDRLDGHAFRGLAPERRAQHLLDVARAYCHLGRAREAVPLLLEAERLAPAEIRHRPAAHAVLRDLTRRIPGRIPGPVTDLARRSGIHPG
ncbi:helix-turn-helix transcriptional regulator [Micromonospora sp. NPDC049559]|uniref:helix-turn-helix domain-containing protein n=1 Tax=Micromonospora sp. NPDC049559 TaxID=3155923 RepID=UPI00342E8E4C